MDDNLAEPCDAVPRLPADLVQAPLHALLQVPAPLPPSWPQFWHSCGSGS
jgi:hypothetical protein